MRATKDEGIPDRLDTLQEGRQPDVDLAALLETLEGRRRNGPTAGSLKSLSMSD